MVRVGEPNIALLDVPQIAAPFEHATLDEGNDAGTQDHFASLEVWLRWRCDPLPHRLADDPRRLLPAGIGEGEQLLVKEGDRRGSKTVGVDNAQRRVLGGAGARGAREATSKGLA